MTAPSLSFILTCGKENDNNCDDDYPEPEIIAPAGVIARVAGVLAGVAERSVVAASHMLRLLSVVILCDDIKAVKEHKHQ